MSVAAQRRDKRASDRARHARAENPHPRDYSPQ
jgi:hypothetical protein